MASEQLSRRENTTNEREIHVEKDRVPKMTTHFEQLTVQAGKEPPQGSIEALQGGEINKEHAGKAIGDAGGRGKARETHELGSHFESLADKVSDEDRNEKVSTTTDRDRAAANVVAGDKTGTTKEAAKGREGFGGARDVGKFKMKSLGDESLDRRRGELDSRTRVISGAPENKERNIGFGRGQVVAEKLGRGKMEEARDEEKLRGRVGAENEGGILERGGEQREKERGREAKEKEEEERSTLEEISKYRNQAQQSAMDAISAAQERYERAKQATNETLSNTTQTAQERTTQAKDIAMEKTSQAKDVTLEKGQQGYEATKGTISSAAKTAAEYTTPVVEKAKTVTVQAKDVTVETGKTAAGYAGKVAADLKDKATVAGWTAANYSTELTVEGTKKAANVVEGAAGYAGHKAAELAAKSVDVVKGLAASAGETAKEYTARKKEESWREYEAKRASQPQEGEERPTEGIGETASNYAQKVMPSGESTQGGQAQGANQEGTGSNVLSAIGGTVGNVGEKVKKPFENITSSGNEQSSGQAQGTNQEGTGSNVLSAIGETVGNVGEKVKKPLENITSSGNEKSSGQVQGKGSEAMTTKIGEKLGDAAQSMKKPLDNITEGGSEVLGAVTETVGDIGNNMIKSAEKVQERGTQGGQKGEGGVLDAIGETIVEIAQTTKVIVVGEGEKESRQNIGSESRSSTDPAKYHDNKAPRSV